MPWTIDNYLTLGQLIVTAIGLGLAVWQIFVGVGALKKSAEANGIAANQLEKSAEANTIGVKALQRSAEANEHSAEAGDVAQLMIVLQLELQLGEARMRVLDAKRANVDDFVEPLVEHYLNTLDRFCHCVRLGLVDQSTYRKDYKERLKEAIKNNGDYFKPGSAYLHILHVDRVWSAEDDAADFLPRRLEARRLRAQKRAEAA